MFGQGFMQIQFNKKLLFKKEKKKSGVVSPTCNIIRRWFHFDFFFSFLSKKVFGNFWRV